MKCQYPPPQEQNIPEKQRTCMNAVATMTPDPKNFAMKNIHGGTPRPRFLAAKTGNHVPRNEPARMTKMEEMRTPRRPSKSLLVGQSDIATVVREIAVGQISWEAASNNDLRSDNEEVYTAEQSRAAWRWCTLLIAAVVRSP